MRKLTLILVTIFITISPLITACQSESTPSPPQESLPQEMPEISPEPEPEPVQEQEPPAPTKEPIKSPAKLKVISMTMTPVVTEPGKPVTINVDVMNVGETEGLKSCTLYVNGTKTEVKDVLIKPWNKETTTFNLVKDVSGIYEVEVEGIAETLRVKEPGTYPRLYCYAPVILQESVRDRANWDLVVVQEESRFEHPEYLKLLKELNPNIEILAFIAVGCYTPKIPRPYSIPEDWFLHYPGTNPPEERRVVTFTNEWGLSWYSMNPATEMSTWIPEYVHDEVMSTGLFDGVFYDCVGDVWISNVDIDNDGIADSAYAVNREYQKGFEQLLQLTRELLGPEVIIVGNPGIEWAEDSPYWEYANGHMQECCLSTETWSNHWPKIWEIYQRNMQKPSPHARVHLIDATPEPEDLDVDEANLLPSVLKRMRFGLAITLLGDGYFFYGSCVGENYFWWFPEYDANLGFATGDAKNHSDGTWTREFENGTVVVNPTFSSKTMQFEDIYKDVSTGTESQEFTIESEDGRIYVKIP